MADGRVKLYVTSRALRCRRDRPGLFAHGAYLPGEPGGARAEHAFGFARRQGGDRAVAVVPRLLTRLVPREGLPVGAEVWGDTHLRVGGVEADALSLQNVFTGQTHSLAVREGRLVVPVAEVLSDFPVALLVTER